MPNNNLDVVAQEPNKPRTRRVVGVLTAGEQPTDLDYQLWGFPREAVIGARECRVDGDRVYLVTVQPGHL